MILWVVLSVVFEVTGNSVDVVIITLSMIFMSVRRARFASV